MQYIILFAVIVGIIWLSFKRIYDSLGPRYRIKIISRTAGEETKYFIKDRDMWIANLVKHPSLDLKWTSSFPYPGQFDSKEEAVDFLETVYLPREYPTVVEQSYAEILRERSRKNTVLKQKADVYDEAESLRKLMKAADERGDISEAGRIAEKIEDLWLKNPITR